MKRFSPLALALPLTAGCHVRPESLLPADAAPRAVEHSAFLLRGPDSFVVLGDESSFVWPKLLQELLDLHQGRRNVDRVFNAAAVDAAIGAWESLADEGPFETAVRDFLAPTALRRGSAPAPKTALCVVSLRGLGDERGPVKSTTDMVGAERGADALETLARALHATGVEQVAFATPLYREDGGAELGLEHVAIERLLARGLAFVSAGPDLFQATRRYFPDAYEPDRSRPNEFGQKLLAEEWYRWLAGPDAREDVVETLYAEAFDVEAIEAAHAGAGP